MNQCFIDVYVDIDHNDWYSDRVFKARKPHQCGECGDTISPGDSYEKTTFLGGRMISYKTCLPCKEIRDAFFCSWIYTQVWEHLWEEVRWGDDIPMCSFNGFSRGAVDKMCDFLDELEESEKEDD